MNDFVYCPNNKCAIRLSHSRGASRKASSATTDSDSCINNMITKRRLYDYLDLDGLAKCHSFDLPNQVILYVETDGGGILYNSNRDTVIINTR